MGITRVEVGEEGLHFITDQQPDDVEEEENGKVALVVTIDKELLRRLEASDHPDFAIEDITRVEVGEERLHLFSDQEPGATDRDLGLDLPAPEIEDQDETLQRVNANSIEEQSRSEEDEREEEMLARAIAMSLEE